MFKKIHDFTNDLLDRPIPTVNEIRENWNRRHHPVKYVTQHYVKSLNFEKESTTNNWSDVSNNLVKLSAAEKNFAANNPRPSYIRKFIGVVGSLASILAITHAEKVDALATKAWPQVFKERDQD